MSAATVECPVDGCRTKIGILYVMCNRCWADVPKALGNRVYSTWGHRCRHRDDGAALEAHQAAKQATIDHVNELRREREPQTRLAL